jgi:hypothetical protein
MKADSSGVQREISKNESLASTEVFQTLKRRGHPEGPPPTISDSWGGIDAAISKTMTLSLNKVEEEDHLSVN